MYVMVLEKSGRMNWLEKGNSIGQCYCEVDKIEEHLRFVDMNLRMGICFPPDIFNCLDISTEKELDLTKAVVLPSK